MTTRRLTGWHAFAIFAGCFAVIITANLALAFSAVRSFPGVETRNSYVESQTFDVRRAAQEALGWTVTARHAGGLLILSITDAEGLAVEAQTLSATLGRPTHVKDDRSPDLRFDGQAYVAREALEPGNWNLRLRATARDGTAFSQRVVFAVKG